VIVREYIAKGIRESICIITRIIELKKKHKLARKFRVFNVNRKGKPEGKLFSKA